MENGKWKMCLVENVICVDKRKNKMKKINKIKLIN